MKRTFTSLLLIGATFFSITLLGSITVFSEEKNAGKSLLQENRLLDTSLPVKLKYLLYLPKDYKEKKALPVIMFLHGMGEWGNDLEKVKVHGPPKLIEKGQNFPFIVISPQCPEGRWWEPSELVALLDQVSQTHKVDQDRIYLTGLSMGGFGTWRLAQFAPNRFAAIAPICGGGEHYWAKHIAHIPIWAFHGAKDTGVPPARSEDMINAIKRIKGHHEPKLTIYPDARHDSWTETYNNPELYKWFLEQKRSKKLEAKLQK